MVSTIGGLIMGKFDDIKVLAFDVFGTVVDFYGTIVQEGAELNHAKGLDVDWGAFALAWRSRYHPAMERVMRGETAWTNLDALHRQSLEDILIEFGLTDLSEDEKTRLNQVWHRLRPWPDSVAGLHRLRQRFILTPLSNGNVALLVDMAKYSGLPWDCILSAELIHAYKPDPRTYRMVGELLMLPPQQVMLVAAHADDLRSAQAQGLRAAYVPRPLEYGPNQPFIAQPDPAFDIVATDFVDLAQKLLL